MIKTHDKMVGLIRNALSNGGTRDSMMRTSWDISGDCMNSHETVMTGRPDKPDGQQYVTIAPGRKSTLQLTMLTRCRKCTNCLEYRTRLWRARSIQETKLSARTWFGTLTLNPQEQMQYLSKARQKLINNGLDYDALAHDDQFITRHSCISPEITKWLKRVRKNSGAPLKYLLVAEAHKTGDPHYHVLVHEQSVDHPVRHKVLSSTWRLGFTKFNLVTNPSQATYLCKYLSKTLAARVRASQAYGKGMTMTEQTTYRSQPPKGGVKPPTSTPTQIPLFGKD